MQLLMQPLEVQLLVLLALAPILLQYHQAMLQLKQTELLQLKLLIAVLQMQSLLMTVYF